MSDYGFFAGSYDEVDQDTLEALYDEALNDTQEWYTFGILKFAPSDILRELDPIAYRTGLSDYHDSLIESGEIVEELADEED